MSDRDELRQTEAIFAAEYAGPNLQGRLPISTADQQPGSNHYTASPPGPSHVQAKSCNTKLVSFSSVWGLKLTRQLAQVQQRISSEVAQKAV